MRADYEPFFQQLKNQLTSLGEFSVEDGDLVSKFYFASDLTVTFECEKYYGPSFTLLVAIGPSKASNSDGGYAVWMLMRVFENLKNQQHEVPTLDNQIKFLIREKETLCGDMGVYDAEYAKLNAIL